MTIALALWCAAAGGNRADGQGPIGETPPAAETTAPASPVENPLAPQIQIPDFHLTQVSIDAEAVKDRVHVDVDVEVVINKGEGWHRIPLRLGQGHVWSRTYTGAGEEVPDTNPRTTDEGISWLIRGIGKHRLKLSMWVPVRRTALGTQFQLSLPPLPPQFESRLKLRIPDGSAVLRTSKNLTLTAPIARSDTQTEIEASVSGRTLDVTWHTPVVTGDVVSHVSSLMQLKPGVEHLSLVVDQTIELQQAGTPYLSIRLPGDFPQFQITGPQYRGHERIPGREDWVRVQIQDDGRNRVELRWIFERDLPVEGGTVTIDGLQVEGAVQEEGKIRIDEFDGYQIFPRTAELELVHRIDVKQFRLLGGGNPLTAYEFVKQPFRLVLDVTPTLPYFTIDPVYEISFLDDQIELSVHSLVRFDRGGISGLELSWKDYESDGWRVVSAISNQEQTGRPLIQSTGEPELLKLVWPNSISKDVRLTCVFQRPLPESLSDPVTLALPVPQSSRTAPAVIVVTAADSYELDVRTASEDLLQRVERDTIDPWKLPDIWTAGARPDAQYFRLADSAVPLSVRTTVHQRKIRAATVVEIDDVTADSLLVRQKVSFDVKYGRLQEIDFVLPQQLRAQMPEHAVAEGVEVRLDAARLPLNAAPGVLKAVLPTARKGSFDVFVEYRFPIESGEHAKEFDLPFLTLADVPFASVQCRVMPFETVQVRSRGNSWSAMKTSPHGAVWIAAPGTDLMPRVPLSIGRRLSDSSQRFVVDKALFRTRFMRDGTTITWAEFQLLAPPARLLIEFPAQSRIKGFVVDGELLPEAAIVRTPGETADEYRLLLPPRSSASRMLVVQYENQLPVPFSLAREQKVEFPRFSRSVWVDQTVWEMRLPEGHHLFTYPSLDPQFEWMRNIVVWQRQPKPAYLEERETLVSGLVPGEFEFEPNSFYAFRGFGPIHEISFRSMNRSLILLIGAGFTLLLGFVFWKLPATRNVFSLVVIAFLFATVSLWYLEPLLLLLQPAVLGVVLALAATVVDTYTRHTQGDASSMRGSKLRLPPLDEGDSANRSTRIYQPVSAGDSKGSSR